MQLSDFIGFFSIGLTYGATGTAVFAGPDVLVKACVGRELAHIWAGFYCCVSKQNRRLVKAAGAEE